VDEEGEDCVPKAVACPEDVEGKEAEKDGKQEP
jgi:hypothetical protein